MFEQSFCFLVLKYCLVMFSSVEGLGVVISPGGKHLISLALAGASVGLDLDATNRLKIDILDIGFPH